MAACYIGEITHFYTCYIGEDNSHLHFIIFQMLKKLKKIKQRESDLDTIWYLKFYVYCTVFQNLFLLYVIFEFKAIVELRKQPMLLI